MIDQKKTHTIIFTALVSFFWFPTSFLYPADSTPLTKDSSGQWVGADLATAPLILPKLDNPKATDEIRKAIEKDVERARKASLRGIGGGFVYQPNFRVYRSGRFQTLLMEADVYSGGVHSAWIYKTFTFDIRTGAFLELPRLFKQKTNWEKALWPLLREDIKDRFEYDSGEFDPSNAKYFHSFALDGQSLWLLFDQCTILSCVSGTYELEIPMKDIKGILASDPKP